MTMADARDALGENAKRWKRLTKAAGDAVHGVTEG
jgi:hypothetical protein